MISPVLRSFLQLKGLDPTYINEKGESVETSIDTIKQLITLLGFNSDDEQALNTYYQQEETRHWLSLLPPVAVCQQSSCYPLEVRLPIDFVTDSLIYRITTEEKEVIECRLTATDFVLLAVNEISDVEFQLYNVELTADLNIGYHQLSLLEEGNESPLAVMSLIITPEHCYQTKGEIGKWEIKGINISLNEVQSGGIKRITDIKEVIKEEQRNEIDVVYLTSSNTFLNSNVNDFPFFGIRSLTPLNIDIQAIKEFTSHSLLPEKMSSVQNSADGIDYMALLRYQVLSLRTLYDVLHNGEKIHQDRLADFQEFVIKRGASLQRQAAYNAIVFTSLSQENPNWINSFPCFDCKATQEWMNAHSDDLLFWSYCQWIAEEQLFDIKKLLTSFGIKSGLYQDFFVADIANSHWFDTNVFCPKIKIGKAPELANIEYENRMLSPFLPDPLYHSGYQIFISLLQEHMRFTDVLNIHDIASLLRVWLVPDNANDEQGVFAYYNVYDLINIVALESYRNQCVIVGEHFDYLPDGLAALLKVSGVTECRFYTH